MVNVLATTLVVTCAACQLGVKDGTRIGSQGLKTGSWEWRKAWELRVKEWMGVGSGGRTGDFKKVARGGNGRRL